METATDPLVGFRGGIPEAMWENGKGQYSITDGERTLSPKKKKKIWTRPCRYNTMYAGCSKRTQKFEISLSHLDEMICKLQRHSGHTKHNSEKFIMQNIPHNLHKYPTIKYLCGPHMQANFHFAKLLNVVKKTFFHTVLIFQEVLEFLANNFQVHVSLYE